MGIVFIIGTDHRYQCETPDLSAEHVQMMRNLLIDAIAANEAVAIAEEMSLAALAEKGLDHSVAQLLAAQLGIRHELVDPSPDERERLGIQQRNEVELAGFLANRDQAEIENQVRRSYGLREEYWATRVAALNAYPIIFICGAAHVESFYERLSGNGHSVEVLVENWSPGVAA